MVGHHPTFFMLTVGFNNYHIPDNSVIVRVH